ncbi:MAG TPA: glycosyltransferase family 2 protein [Mucilaginibacter sp.]|jgi:glycosyltransferase involved in cell wall biosynthesis|nr:glycosyltransferase family 2 protein [Mucilaginibacter sp.]
MPDISFFIPAYNCASTIEESVDSIMTSNFGPGDELIITNDCSTDTTGDILAAIQKKYPGIKIITHSRNKGGGAARNTCIENSRNEFFFCLDSDNALEKNSIAPLKQYLLDNQADVAVFQHLYYFSSGIDKIDNIWSLPSGIFTSQDCLSRIFSPGASGNYLFTKESWQAAGGYPEYAGALDTWGFGLRQLMTGSKMIVLADSYYYHRLLKDSYYLRDAWARRKSVSLRALQLIIPFFDEIEDESIDYIFSKRGRYSWFENLEKHPIKVSPGPKKTVVWKDHIVDSPKRKNLFRRILNKIRSFFPA